MTTAKDCNKKGGIVRSGINYCNSHSIDYRDCKQNTRPEPDIYACCTQYVEYTSCPPPEGFIGSSHKYGREWKKSSECKGGKVEPSVNANDCLTTSGSNCTKDPKFTPAPVPSAIPKGCCVIESSPMSCPADLEGTIIRIARQWDSEDKCKDSGGSIDSKIDEGQCVNSQKVNCWKRVPPPIIVFTPVPTSTPTAPPPKQIGPVENGTAVPGTSPTPEPAPSVSPIPSPSNTPGGCCICQYGNSCGGKEAVAAGLLDCEVVFDGGNCQEKIAVPDDESSLLEAVCICEQKGYEKISYMQTWHGSSNECGRPFDAAKLILANSTCSELNVTDFGCEVFSNAWESYAYAISLKDTLASCCKRDVKVTITAGQTGNNLLSCANNINFSVCLTDGEADLEIDYEPCSETGKECYVKEDASDNDSYCKKDGKVHKQNCNLKPGCTPKGDCNLPKEQQLCCKNGAQGEPEVVDDNSCVPEN